MKINELRNFIKKVVNETFETKEIDNLLKGIEPVNILTLEIGDASKEEDKKMNLALAKFVGKNKASYASEYNYSDIEYLIDEIIFKGEKTIYYKNEDGYKTWVELKKYLTDDRKWQIVRREVQEGEGIDYFITKLK